MNGPKKTTEVQSPQLVILCKRFEFISDDIDKEVNEEHIWLISRELENWKLVAAHLGFTHRDISNIEFTTYLKFNVDLMREKMMKEWKMQNNGMATYRLLLEALLKADCFNSALHVCGKYKSLYNLVVLI